MVKKIYALVLHEVSPKLDCTILSYYSSREKVLCSLQERADIYDVKVIGEQTELIRYQGEFFFYCVREYDLL